MMKWIYILGYLVLTTSCCKQKPLPSFKYQNGVSITDSMHLYPILRELKELDLDRPLPADYIVYSSLYPTIQTDLNKTLLALEDSIYPYVEARDEREQKQLKRLRSEHQVLEIGVVVIDNKTGQIISEYSSWGNKEKDAITGMHQLNGMNNTLLMTLAMSSNYKPTDIYPQLWKSVGGYYTVGPDSSIQRSFYTAFSMEPAKRSYGLHAKFHKYEMYLLLEDLKWDHFVVSRPPFGFYSLGSLLDVTKTYTAFYNEGQLNTPTLIDSITNRAGKILYKRKQTTHTVLDQETAFEMLQLLDYYAHCGVGAAVKNNYKKAPDFYGNFAVSNLPNKTGWFMTIQKDYTIGIYVGAYFPNFGFKDCTSQFRTNVSVPLWLQTIASLNKYRSVPTKRHSSDLKRIFDSPCLPMEKEPVELPDIEI